MDSLWRFISEENFEKRPNLSGLTETVVDFDSWTKKFSTCIDLHTKDLACECQATKDNRSPNVRSDQNGGLGCENGASVLRKIQDGESAHLDYVLLKLVKGNLDRRVLVQYKKSKL